MAGVLRGLLGFPLRLVRAPVGFIVLLVGTGRRRTFGLPVAGLSEHRAQPVHFTLKRAASSREEQAVADRWLEALTVCQVASGLLLRELDAVEANLRYWRRQEQAGGHFWSALLRRGPLHFLGQLALLLHISRPAEGALDESGLIEKRVLIFRLLRSALCEALARVNAAAALLYLQQQPAAPRLAGTGAGAAAAAAAAPAVVAAAAPPGGGVGHAASAADIAAAAAAEEGLFQRADRLVTASLAEVAEAFAALDRSVHATLDAQQGPAAPPVDDQQVLQGALSRVLGLHHLRRIFSRLQLHEQPPPAAGGPAAAAAAAGAAAGAPLAGGAAGAPAPVGGLVTAAAALAQARRAVGLTQLLPANATVHTALQAAQRTVASMRGRRLVKVPRWARMPSDLQQHWVFYTAASLASGYGAIFLFKHSRLSGSRDLDRWVQRGLDSVRGAWKDHVVGPLDGVRAELFNTYRRRPTIVSMDDYEADRDSLARMLEDFQRDFVRKRGAAAATAPPRLPPAASSASDAGSAAAAGGNASAADAAYDSAAEVVPAVPGGAAVGAESADERRLLEGMELVMRTYEREMQRPLRNLVGGELVRALLIQVQKLKVDTASAMLEMDQILKANELSISLLAAVPAFLIAGTSLYYLGRMVTPTPPDPRREALPVRMALVEVERQLEHVATAEEAAAAAAEAEPADAAVEVAEQRGLFAYRLAVVYEEARQLFRRHRGLIALGGSEWPNIRADLLELASPGGVDSRLRVAQRMMRSYTVFQARM
ncbi:Nuclear control of ATPase [Chlorella sorokiniana]|uniref:Nuclear control of ATPase n=1 Tax=Chlorella sorokiniana TaxID=3076 RepID=A0A2P6TQ04_CHLSO|nr:Nuclear control of ATPase [Chlorella sorokiniana]|eukprot:PRW56115.1 Nuclear control of ATPase [Chlorella sorokiniana]